MEVFHILIFLQWQGAMIGILLGLGWLLTGCMRRRESRRRTHETGDCQSGSWAWNAINHRTCSQTEKAKKGMHQWPGITIVLPVKGYRKHSMQNWQSQLQASYSGPLEYLFVVDSQADPAYYALCQLLKCQQNAEILISQKATCTSQKICNLQTAILSANPAHKWVLCLDDDVHLHPSTLDDLVAAAEADPFIFMVTGYPFDVPEAGASLWTYCCLVYHLPLVIAFSLRQRTSFVWGGFMLLPLAELRSDKHGVMQSWSQGGYSDDLILASKCSEQGLEILCPSFAIFPQWLDKECSMGKFWNYLRRQLYVMDTYTSKHNKHLNHTMLALHSYLSMVFVMSAMVSTAQLGAWIHDRAVLGLGAASRPPDACLAFFVAFIGAHAALRWMTGIILDLFSALDLGKSRVCMHHFNWCKLWLGFCVSNAMMPLCAAFTWLNPGIIWSGVRYNKQNGRIVTVHHPQNS